MTQGSPLDEDAVADFLADNEDFLTRRPELLPEPDSPASGTVVPLAERQIAALRERNAALRERITVILANATENERIFGGLRTFTLALMDAGCLADVSRAIGRDLISQLDVDHAACFVEGRIDAEDCPHLTGVAGPPPLPHLFAHAEPQCRAARPAEYVQLFPNAAIDAPGSVALVPLDLPSGVATLALGAKDPQRFTPDKGKLFLEFLRDVTSRALRRLRPTG